MLLELDLSDRCECGCPNLNIWGTHMNGRVKIEVRCKKCGIPLLKVEKDGA